MFDNCFTCYGVWYMYLKTFNELILIMKLLNFSSMYYKTIKNIWRSVSSLTWHQTALKTCNADPEGARTNILSELLLQLHAKQKTEQILLTLQTSKILSFLHFFLFICNICDMSRMNKITSTWHASFFPHHRVIRKGLSSGMSTISVSPSPH